MRCSCRALQRIVVVWLDSTGQFSQVTAWMHDRSQLNSGVRELRDPPLDSDAALTDRQGFPPFVSAATLPGCE